MTVESSISVQISVTPNTLYKIFNRYAKIQNIKLKYQEEPFIDVSLEIMLQKLIERYDELVDELCLFS